jgi:FkbM family methyltransferase
MSDKSLPSPEFGLQAGDTLLRLCKWGPMMFNLHDSAIGRALALYGEFAESENVLMSQFLRTGDIAVNAGANVGTVALFLAQSVGAEGRVYAFEPQNEIFHYLCGNVALGGHRNVIYLNAATGAENGTIEAPAVDYGSEDNFGAVSFVGQGPGDTDVRTIDGLNLDRCRLIKINVEGMEPDVLEGAKKTIDTLRPFVYTKNKSGENSPTIIRFFLDRDYTLYWHFAYSYRKGNFNNVDMNVFGDTGDINLVCVPPPDKPSEKTELNLPAVSGPDADWEADCRAWNGEN